jgi:HrpA-like RNA helicase
VGQLVALGALQQQPGQDGESLTPLGSHLCAMPMDAALGKALLYGCMLRWEGQGEGLQQLRLAGLARCLQH